MSKRGKPYKTTADALNASFAISDSDADDSKDEFECRSDDESDSNQMQLDTKDADDTYDDDDDDILYQLAGNSVESDNSSEDEVNSDDDECEWSKQPFVSLPYDFDSVKVVLRKPFLTSDTPVDFFMKFFDEEVFDIIVGETNVYAHQNKLRNWSDTS